MYLFSVFNRPMINSTLQAAESIVDNSNLKLIEKSNSNLKLIEKKNFYKKCPHNKRKCYCKQCDGASVCKIPCPKAGGRIFCCSNCRVVRPAPPEVKINKPYRKCPHGKRKSTCIQCNGACLCKAPCANAGRLKMYCAKCGGSMLCKCCQFTKVARKGDFCNICLPIASKKSHVREARMAAKLRCWTEAGPMRMNTSWNRANPYQVAPIQMYTTWNRVNPSADPAQCGRYRPDFVYELPVSVVLKEYDEHQHRDRALRCELVRMAEISLGYGGQPVHWVRFNPDSFRVNGVLMNYGEAVRDRILYLQLKEAVECVDYEHFITITFVCYSVNSGRRTLPNTGDCSGGFCDSVRVYKFKTIDDYTRWAEGRLALVEKH